MFCNGIDTHVVKAMPGNLTGPTDLFIYVNSITCGYFGLVILFCIFSISFMTQIRFGFTKAFVTASFITSTVTAIMLPLGMVSSSYVILPVVLLGISALILYSEKR